MRITLLHRFTLLAFSLMFTSFVYGQEVTVRGRILDAVDSLELIGVNVFEKGNPSNGTATDYDGSFQLTVPADAVLVFSYTGYTSIEMRAQAGFIDVLMETASQVLEDVVVIGYGIQKKRLATGAIAQISNENLEGLQFQDVQSALEGQISGLIVNESSGQPGAGKSILIRGISTNGDNSPLYIVDGLQVNSISNLNPNDIESLDVLKDAASSAIYGSRGANGVVIITTKKGVEGEARITYEGFASASNPWKLPEMLGAQDYISLTREKFANGNQLSSLETLGFPQEGESTPNTDWMDQIFNQANIQRHTLSVSAKNLFLSMEYWDEDGVVGGDQSNYKRYAIRLNSDKQINDFLRIGENLYVNRIDNQQIGVNDAFGTVIADAFAYDPITQLYDESKDYGFAQSDWVKKEYINPLSRLFLANNEGHSDNILGNVFLEVEPMEDLRFRSDFGVDYSWYKFRSFTPDYYFHDAFFNPVNTIGQGYGYSQTYQFENYLNYRKDVGLHSFDAVLGMTYRQSENEWSGGSSQNIPDDVKFNPNWQYIDSGIDSTDLAYGGAAVKYVSISYYGRLIYDYRDKYLLTATLRRDGSSNFGSANRWGIFPSFSLGWVLSDESFFRSRNVSFLKLRASWGVNGNDRIPPLAFASTIQNVFTYPFGTNQSIIRGSALATPPNPNIRWEESVQLDFGLDVRMFNDALTATFDYYVKDTRGLLMTEVIPGYIGATNNPISNLGEIRNTGFEASISHRTRIKGVKLTTTLNYTTFRNEVTKVASETGFINGWVWPVRNTPITRMTEGFPVGHFVGYKTDGIFQSDAAVFAHINRNGDPYQPRAKAGDIRFVDVNGDGVINSEDITNIGNPWPKHIIGLSFNAEYKGFDVQVLLSAQLGHQIFRAYERSDITFTNYQTFWLDRWTPENPSSEYPRLVSNDPNNNQRPSDFYLEDASFLRLRNLQIGYNLPQRMLDRFNLNGLRIYLSANNLFTLTGYKGFDPDIGTNGWILDTGIDKGFYPTNRTVGGGVRITL